VRGSEQKEEEGVCGGSRPHIGAGVGGGCAARLVTRTKMAYMTPPSVMEGREDGDVVETLPNKFGFNGLLITIGTDWGGGGGGEDIR
jgi:hypothetical protein